MGSPLRLSDADQPQSLFNGDFSIGNMSWWFWIKAGIGFTLGAGAVYIAASALWIAAITEFPGLFFLRLIAR